MRVCGCCLTAILSCCPQVGEGTQELQSELDEAYDRCDVLGREVGKLKVTVEEMGRAAASDKGRLVQLADEVRCLGCGVVGKKPTSIRKTP